MSKVNLKIVSAVTLILIWLLISLLISCSPVKRVLLNDKYYKQVTDKFVLDGGCEADTFFRSDTTVLLDTLYSLDFKTDTFTIDNIKTIVKTEYKTVTKTVTIRDTAIVPDKKRTDLLLGQIAEKDNLISAKNAVIDLKQKEVKEWKIIARNRNLMFWGLVFSILVFTFRKPIFGIIRKSIIKI